MQPVIEHDIGFTYADYCTWPDDERWELIDGEAYAMGASSLAHQRIIGEIFIQLRNYLRGKKCQVFLSPCDVRLDADGYDNDVVQPDVLVVCDEKKLEDGKSVVGAPDLVIEVLSPSSSTHDLVRKYLLYQQSGVQEYWVVDHDNKLVYVNILTDGKFSGSVYENSNGIIPVGVLDGCSIDMTEVFADPQ